MPVLTLLIIIFIIWLNYEMRKTSGKQKNTSDDFWAKENSSNLVRRKDISGLDFLTVTTDSLPMEDKEDTTINSYRDTILKLTGAKLINLGGLSNTEIKSQYGPANMSLLSEYENNYITLVSMLQKWADRLYAGGFIEDAQSVLEYAVSVKSTVTGTYKLLAEIYRLSNTPEKINELIDTMSDIPIHNKDKLIRSLKALIP